jgi:hypothetical protein
MFQADVLPPSSGKINVAQVAAELIWKKGPLYRQEVYSKSKSVALLRQHYLEFLYQWI